MLRMDLENIRNDQIINSLNSLLEVKVGDVYQNST